MKEAAHTKNISHDDALKEGLESMAHADNLTKNLRHNKDYI